MLRDNYDQNQALETLRIEAASLELARTRAS